jgi:hypothetical protein
MTSADAQMVAIDDGAHSGSASDRRTAAAASRFSRRRRSRVPSPRRAALTRSGATMGRLGQALRDAGSLESARSRTTAPVCRASRGPPFARQRARARSSSWCGTSFQHVRRLPASDPHAAGERFARLRVWESCAVHPSPTFLPGEIHRELRGTPFRVDFLTPTLVRKRATSGRRCGRCC